MYVCRLQGKNTLPCRLETWRFRPWLSRRPRQSYRGRSQGQQCRAQWGEGLQLLLLQIMDQRV